MVEEDHKVGEEEIIEAVEFEVMIMQVDEQRNQARRLYVKMKGLIFMPFQSVTLEIPGREKLEWERVYMPKPAKVISSIRARKLVGKGEMFPTGFPGMPSNRDIDFCIDLEPGTYSISIPPYRMAPTGLREIKAQIEELLDKGCVSFSKIDLRFGYHQLKIWPEDVPNMTFRNRYGHCRVLSRIEVRATFIKEIKAKQFKDDSLNELKKKTVSESHGSRYSIYPGVTKMYQDLKRLYWWPDLKKNIAEFVAKCQNCQHVKYEHLRPVGFLQRMSISEWKWERIAMDFVVGLPKTLRNFDSIWVVVHRLTKSSHFIPVRIDYNAQQMSKVYVKEIVRLYRVTISIISDRGRMAYWLALPVSLSGVHLVFHVSTFKRYHGNGDYIIKWNSILLDNDLQYEVEPVAILDRDIQKLRTKEIK
ncbi:uncharacterized protein LOC125855910 [Solanum stenotomum]|uniref:uncharacterized protein LOC125855910 n=1 Tax=Solanum stenotomum TaxID=172797 RepID=UPI0020D0B84C|nr:uncharacterized protein LOC125855910 [Solanum stenotomum]